MSVLLDTTTEFGSRVDRRLKEEAILWLVTVSPDGTPQPSPVWFLWDGRTILVYSRPNTPKLRNIRARPTVAVHLEGDGRGGNIVILTGDARIDAQAPHAHQVAEFARKYESGGYFARIGMTAEGFARAYSVPIRVTPSKLRGH